MRLKEDNSSWKSSGIKHRDNRHDKSFDGSVGQGKKKNTKKWCRGKVGKRHEFTYREYKSGRRIGNDNPTMELACAKCGKSFEVDYDWSGCSWARGLFGNEKPKGEEKLTEEWTKKLYGEEEK